MAYDTIVQQGRFTADGNNKTISIRSDVDKIVIENYTEMAATNNGHGYRYTWNKGMGSNVIAEYHPAADHTAAVDIKSGCISVFDSSNIELGSKVAITAGTDVTQPVYSTGDTTDLSAGSIVRLVSTSHDSLNGLDFSITSVVANTSFTLANALANAIGRVAGTGHYRLVAKTLDEYKMMYPSNRVIANISKASSAVVTTLVDHGYAVGMKVKFKVPSVNGMVELDGISGDITAVTDSTFTVNVDTSGMTTFAFPQYGDVPCDYAVVVPVGDDKTSSGYNAPGAFTNDGKIGVTLTAGTIAPAGSNNDVIYWTAYKSFEVDND